jgi:hypothetical protein
VVERPAEEQKFLADERILCEICEERPVTHPLPRGPWNEATCGFVSSRHVQTSFATPWSRRLPLLLHPLTRARGNVLRAGRA